ncbi:MAG: Gfo/Idh/MocA family oxidoreductase [Lentisphaeria bacterium]
MTQSPAPVRLGIIGFGNMGRFHAEYLRAGRIAGAELAAVCDVNPEALQHPLARDIRHFTDSRKCIRSGKVDAVIVATPHYDHTVIGIDALKAGLHVLVEKPISVHKADCQRLIAAHQNKKQVFAAMFNQRSNPLYQKVRELIQNGELGALVRVNWIVSDWFRTQAYYDSGNWRATWGGEGGGVLMNQCPHNLDLLQWLCGMPRRVRAFCKLGARHRIEVEDQVTAYLEYDNGATGVFITSTGEAPGTNRLEIAGERGKILVENGKLLFYRNETPADEFLRTSTQGFGAPGLWNIEIPVPAEQQQQHQVLMQGFIDAIRLGKPLLAPAAEGIHSVELANAMLYSSALETTVELPLNAAAYEKQLKRWIAGSKLKKTAAKKVTVNFGASFQK